LNGLRIETFAQPLQNRLEWRFCFEVARQQVENQLKFSSKKQFKCLILLDFFRHL